MRVVGGGEWWVLTSGVRGEGMEEGEEGTDGGRRGKGVGEGWRVCRARVACLHTWGRRPRGSCLPDMDATTHSLG